MWPLARKEKHMTHAKHLNGKSGLTALTCPACGSIISPETYERILRLDEARAKKLHEERDALEHERAALQTERKEIASRAVATERAKWEADKARIAREIDRLQKQSKVEQDRTARAYEKHLETERRRNEANEKKLAQMKTNVKADAAARVRDAKRAAEAAQRGVIEELQSQLKTSEQRRHRDEENFKNVVTELRRKAEARDREHLGIEGEDDLVEALRAEFPGDRVEHRGKGGDVILHVMDGGKEAGVVVTEVKNRSTWSADYVGQTQRAMETHNTKYGVLVSRVLPARKNGMCVMRGVIVVAPFIAAQVIRVMRDGIVAIYRLGTSEQDKTSKMSLLFAYLRSEEFETAMLRVTTKIAELRDSLARERSNHDGVWRFREQHYSAIVRAAAGIDTRVRELLGGPSTVRTKVLALPISSAQ
jgi:hypothetical protein